MTTQPVVGVRRLFDALRRWDDRTDTPAHDAVRIALRVALAWLFVYHGAATLFGAFGGAGIHRSAVFFAGVAGLRPGTFFAVVNGLTEFVGGIAIGVGVLGRLAAFGLVCDMTIAMCTVTWHNGIVSAAAGSGYEINVALAALAIGVVVLGTGRYSLAVAGRRLLAGRRPTLHGRTDPAPTSRRLTPGLGRAEPGAAARHV
ncbi:MAG TPA: DoxX family protein [Acidimicrobiales bacterium]|nr:DoxX family protein [Acidimicrobiales bacterium]